MEKCPDCGGNIVEDPRTLEACCSTCGLVTRGTTLEEGKEWNHFEPGHVDRRRAEYSPMLGYTFGNPREEKDTEKQAMLWRMKRRQTVSISSPSRLYMRSRSILQGQAGALNLPPGLTEKSLEILNRVNEKGLAKGRNLIYLSAASIKAACRQLDIPRTLQEIAESLKLDQKELANSYRLITWKLELNTPTPKPEAYIPRIGSAFMGSMDVQNRTLEIIEAAREHNLTAGKLPRGVAASAFYIAGKELDYPLTQKAVAEASGITEVTIRNRYKEIELALGKGGG
jgi:transcription initiation factor TFIIB